MKKNLLTAVAVASAIATLSTSCSKDQPINQATDLNISVLADSVDVEEIAYEKTLDAVSYGLLDLALSTEFKNVLNTEVLKQFDGDDNVLLKDLSVELDLVGIDLLYEMTESLNNHNRADLIPYLSDAIDGLSYDGGVIYAHVFIPFIDGKDLTVTPLVCTNYEDDPVLPGLKWESGTVINISIDELMASTELVWVTAYNESVDNNGSVGNGNPPPPLSIGGNEYQRNLFIHQVYITDKKEGWGNGRADVSYAAVQILPNCSQHNVNGAPFAKVSNANLNSWYVPAVLGGARTALAHITLGNFWDQQLNEDLPAVYYERDVRKKFKKTHVLVPNCGASTMHFNSKESIYGVIVPSFSDYPSGGTAYYKDYQLSGASIRYLGLTDIQ